MDADSETVASIASFCRLDLLQFHGRESAAYCSRFDHRVIKAIRVRNRNDLQEVLTYRDVVDGVLLDTYVPHQGGGTGKTFDWRLAKEARTYGRIILAGGLNHENVARAVSLVKPYAVVASSGLERSPGVKDHEKLARFIEEVRAATRQ